VKWKAVFGTKIMRKQSVRKTKLFNQKASRQKILSRFNGSLLLVGAGKMGCAMLNGWLGCGLSPKKLVVIEPHPMVQLKTLALRGLTLNPTGTVGNIGAIVIAVKPQTASDAVPSLYAQVGRHTLVLSIMAGRTLDFLQAKLPPNAAIVRAMPNTPAAVGRGITVAVANANVSARQRKQASNLLTAIGKVEWVGNEKLMDAVTAVSGSGPAYVFLLAEAMSQAGIAAGLPAELAERLVRETVAGSGELLARSPYETATLRQNVTSPGGTTAAALDILMGTGGFTTLLTKAIAAATKRARELAG
jgi:pyrroline-5-carboxylate reductase